MKQTASKSRGFEDLDVWQKAIRLSGDIYKITREFPKEELYGLVSQMRRSVISISSNIAEGSSRGSKRDFARFIGISIGSAAELKSQCFVAIELGYLSRQRVKEIVEKINHIGAMLKKLQFHMLEDTKAPFLVINDQRLTINDQRIIHAPYCVCEWPLSAPG